MIDGILTKDEVAELRKVALFQPHEAQRLIFLVESFERLRDTAIDFALEVVAHAPLRTHQYASRWLHEQTGFDCDCGRCDYSPPPTLAEVEAKNAAYNKRCGLEASR